MEFPSRKGVVHSNALCAHRNWILYVLVVVKVKSVETAIAADMPLDFTVVTTASTIGEKPYVGRKVHCFRATWTHSEISLICIDEMFLLNHFRIHAKITWRVAI